MLSSDVLVLVLIALVIAVLTVPPVTKPLSPSATEPVPNLAVHSFTFSSVKLDALVLALVASLVSTVVDNSLNLGAIASVIEVLDTFTL